MKLLIITVILVGLCIFLLAFNIIFRKDGKFPDGEIGHNKELRKRGLMCAKAEEKKLWGYTGKERAKGCPERDCSDKCEMGC